MKISEKGFTLLEVLVAIAILGVGIVSSMQLFGNCLKSIGKADQYTRAVFLAKGILDNDPSPLEVDIGETSGIFDEPFEQFKWKKTISNYARPKAPSSDSESLEKQISVKTVEITVSIGFSEDEERSDIVELHTLKTYFDQDEQE